MREYEEKENKIIQQIAEIRTKLDQIAIKPKILQHLHHFTNIMKEKIHNLTQSQKQKLVRLLVEKVILDSNEGKARIIAHVPLLGEKETNFNLKGGLLSMTCWSHGQCPINWLKFELEVKVQVSSEEAIDLFTQQQTSLCGFT